MDAESNFETNEIGAEAGVIGKMLNDTTHSASGVMKLSYSRRFEIVWMSPIHFLP